MGPEGEGQPPRIGGWHLALQEGDRELQPLQTSNSGVRDRASRGDSGALATHSLGGRPPHGVPARSVHCPGGLDPPVYSWWAQEVPPYCTVSLSKPGCTEPDSRRTT